MKTTTAALAITVLLASLVHAQSTATNLAVTAGPQVGSEPFITLTVAPWLTAASGQWEVQGVTREGVLRSKLEWNSIDSALLLVKGRVQLLPAFAVGGSYGSGSLFDGRNTDSDSIQPPNSFDDYLFSRSESDTTGDTQLYDVNLYLDLLQLSKGPHLAGQ
ncbi:MAG: hypothetical protein WCL16_09780, partial [bacterium]